MSQYRETAERSCGDGIKEKGHTSCRGMSPNLEKWEATETSPCFATSELTGTPSPRHLPLSPKPSKNIAPGKELEL